MRVKELQTMVKALDERYWDTDNVGVRFDNRELKEGFVFENSKHNPNREDERVFPIFDSEEYEELPELDGTSVWTFRAIKDLTGDYGFAYDHCYLVTVDETGYHDDPDEGEELFKECTVLEVIF